MIKILLTTLFLVCAGIVLSPTLPEMTPCQACIEEEQSNDLKVRGAFTGEWIIYYGDGSPQ